MLAAPSYSSKLGAYNDNSYARAQSDSSVGIDYMFVSCSAYYPSGSFIGSDNNSNPSGTKVLALSATVEAPDLFDFQVGSADSQHVYRTAGYNEVRHFLIWPE
ncbi:hypothetical protein EDD66_105252 [Mobilisporobacter senegalensis]|uniref:Uncharacterized protein n=1 Tax=Mobilisporobacter senegalensis TaxID=1329262 RepID=A0A3N1XQ61_9FIRM|nr:hypothetical protein [Mobilisporobacter senegalensis]ROR28311.1 hypothetical protein EDD66_105252 [Mobilisporobacter senegalensis]